MNAEATDAEIIFDQDGVRVTDRIVSTESGTVIRIADIQRVQIKYEDNGAKRDEWLAYILGVLGFAFLCWRDWPKDFSFSDLFVFEIPAIIFFIRHSIALPSVRVLAHCNSGVIDVSRRWSRHFQSKQWEHDQKSMQILAEAIGKAMAQNKA